MKDRSLFVIKIGSSFPELVSENGDFDLWTLNGCRVHDNRCRIIDAEHGQNLPDPAVCAGVVLTGSHSMVTDYLPWSERTAEWIRQLLDERIPILGICYGHQLLAHAVGARVGFLPGGIEIGTAAVHRRRKEAVDDPLFVHLPACFQAQTAHSQTVLELPDDAVHLASSRRDPHHAFRIGDNAWGVQFHPEFSPVVMREYVRRHRTDIEQSGQNYETCFKGVTETPQAQGLLSRFADLCLRSVLSCNNPD
ncbi:glutamine amidotransferase [Spirochaeta dissipatitropha]